MAKQRPGRCRVYGGGVLNVSALAVAGPANQSAQATPALQGFEHDRGEVDALLPACREDAGERLSDFGSAFGLVPGRDLAAPTDGAVFPRGCALCASSSIASVRS